MVATGPNNLNGNPNQGPMLFPKNPIDLYAQQQASWIAADREHRATFEENLENIKVVPALVGSIGLAGANISTTFQTDLEVNGRIVSPSVSTDSVYQTEHGYHHATHHHGHPSKPRRTLLHPLEGKSKRPAVHDAATMNRDHYSSLRKAGAPRGWKFRLDHPMSPISKFGMLSTGGHLYDVDGLRIAGEPAKNPADNKYIALGRHHNGSNLWRYLPSIKVAAAATNLSPTLENRAALEDHLTANAGPAWLMEPDPLKIIESYGPQWKGTLIDRLRMQGAMDTTSAEIAHLVSISNGLGQLALNSGKYEGTF